MESAAMTGSDLITVHLDDFEWLYGMILGWAQFREATRNGRYDSDNFKNPDRPQDRLGQSINGKCGELAYCKWRGIFYEPRMNGFKGPDAESDVQIRALSEHWYKLPHKTRDNPNHRYLLMTGWAPVYVMRGWMPGVECRRDEFWDEAKGQWMVPQQNLWSMETWER